MQASIATPEAVVLLSGGLDSATSLAIAKSEGFECYALTFDYGQCHRLEIEVARKVATALGVERHVIVEIDLAVFGNSAITGNMDVPKNRSEHDINSGIPVTYVPARNTIFLSFALAYAETIGAEDTFIGVNAVDYSGYPDCRDEFIKSLENTLNLAMEYEFKIHAPLMWLNKAESVKIMKRLGGLKLLKYTQTCYEGRKRACGVCPACKLRLKGFKEAGEEDPVEYEK